MEDRADVPDIDFTPEGSMRGIWIGFKGGEPYLEADGLHQYEIVGALLICLDEMRAYDEEEDSSDSDG